MFGKKKKKDQKKQRPSSKSAASKSIKKQSSKSAAPSADKKKAAAPKLEKVKKPVLKHSEAFENGTGGDKPIIIKGKGAAPKKRSSRRELRRVAKVGGFTVFDGPRTGKTFATEKEAVAYAVDVLIRTGEVVEVQKTDRQVSHTFTAPNTETK